MSELEKSETNFDDLLNNPDFLKAMEKKGFKKDEFVLPDYEGKVKFYDGVERTLNWDFQTVIYLHYMMTASEIEQIDPRHNLHHFMILVFAMCVQDMLDNKGMPNEKYLPFDHFAKIFPSKVEEIDILAGALDSVMIRNKKLKMSVS